MAKGASSGISFDEYMRRKDSTKDDDKEEKRKSGLGASSGISFEEYMADKYDSSYSIDSKGVDSWFKSASEFGSSFKQGDTSKYTTDYGAEYKDTIKSLMDQSTDVRRYLRDHKDEIKDYNSVYDSYSQFNQYLRSVDSHINDVNKYYSQFDSEDHYNAHKAYEGSIGELYLRAKLAGDSDEGRIAYTTKDGQNVTWQDLYELKKAEVEYDTLSSKPDWEEKSAELGIESLTFGDGSLSDEDIIFEISRTYMPHELKYAIEDGYTEEQFKDIQAKREYISKKYGMDVVNDIYGDTEKLGKTGNLFWYMDDMTDNEKAVFTYIYNTQGADAAHEWLDPKMSAIEQRKAHRIGSELQEDSPVFANALSVVASLASGIEYVTDAVDYSITGNEQTNALATASSTIRGATAQNIESDFWKFMYNTGMSGVDSLAASTLPGGTILLAGSAAAQGYNDAISRGMSTEDAYFTGFRNGVNEYIFERFSMGNFKGLKDSLASGGKAIAKNLAKTMFVNATEETATEIANIVSDRIFNADLSQVATAYRQYLANGVSPDEAKELVKGDINAQIFEAGLSGAVMGLGFGAIGNTAAYLNYNQATQQWGEDIINNDGVDHLKTLANDVAGVSKNNSISKLANKVSTESSRRNARNVGKLSYEVDTARMEQNRSDIVKALEQKGVSKLKAKSYADALVDMNEEFYRGEASTFSLGTDKQWKKITGDENAYSILREVVTNKDSSVNARNTQHNLARSGIKMDIAQEILKENYAEKSDAVKAKVSENGTAKVIKTDTEVTLKGIDHIETVEKDGKEVDVAYLKVADADGNESVVEWGDVEFSSRNEAVLYETFVGMDIDPVHFDAFVKNFNEADFDGSIGEAAVQYAIGFRNAYRYGWANMETELGGDVFASKLTESVRNTAYTLGKETVTKQTEAKHKSLDTAVAERKASGKGKAKTNGKLHMEGVKTTKRTAMQNAGVGLAKRLTDLGIDVYIYESRKVNGQWVDENGNVAPNGYYRAKDGSIHIDLNAGEYGQGIMVYTLAHELTHFMRDKSPKQFKAFADLLVKWYGEKGETLNGLITKTMNDENLSWDDAYEEVIARSCESFLTDSNIADRILELQNTDKGLWETIRDKVLEFLKWMKSLFANVNPESYEGDLLHQYKSEIDHLYDAFYNTLADAVETNQWAGSIAEAKTNAETLATAGITVDANTGSAVMNSVRYAPKTQAEIDKVAKALSESMGVSIEKAKAWVKSETSLASVILDPSNAMFLDYEADDRYEAIKKNAEYPQGTVDFSNLCKKRREFTALLDKLQKEHPNRIITAEEMEKIRQILIEENVEVACGLCYVEERRQLLGEIAQGFIDGYKNGTLKENIAKELDGNDTYVPTIYDLITYDGYRALATEHPSIAEAFKKFNNARGMQAGRLIEGIAEYKRDILNWSQKKVDFVNSVGGLRVFSFSDFEATHLIDLVQVVQDCAAKGVMIQAYTKVPAFANAVKDTNMKVNRSLIAKGTGIKYENGRMVLDLDPVEGIDINDKDFFDSTNSENVGNVLVGMSNEQIRLAMKTPFVDYIIPFHTSLKGEILGAKKIDHWDNYKNFQTDKEFHPEKVTYKKDGSIKSDGWVVAENQINVYVDVIQAAEAEGKPIKNKVDFVNKFLAVAKEKGLKPRFWQFLDVDANGEYTYTEGYHKFLVDFKLFDQQGNILPQKPVVPEFDDALNARILNEYVEGKKMPAPRDAVYDRLENEVINGEGIKKSTRKAVASYTEAQYNAFGWASYNNVITAKERQILFSRFADFKHNRNKYPVTRGGEAVIHSTECPDVIMYVKGSIESPNVTRIVRIKADDGADVSAIQERIVANEFEQKPFPYESIESYYGEEYLEFHRKRDYASFRQYQDSLEEGRGSQESHSVGEGFQDGRRSLRSGVEGNRADGSRVKKSSRRVTAEQDAQYLELAKDPRKNKQALQDMVDEAAKKAGYPVKAYHGTSSFGFTKFDPAMSDDKTTLFFTDDIEVASTYAGRDIGRTKSVADAKSFKYEKGKVYTEAELKEAHDFVQAKYHVYGVTKINVDKQTVTHAGTRYSAKQIIELADHISKQGIYGVYLNTDNVLELDAGYTGWSGLKNPDVVRWEWRIKYQGDGEFDYFKAKADDMFRLELLKDDESVHSGDIQFSEMFSLLRKALGANRAEMAIRNAINHDIGSSRFAEGYSDKSGKYINPTMNTREFAKYAKQKGYDGVVVKNLYDWGGKNNPVSARFARDHKGASTIYILFDSNRVKSADPVTYDEQGNVVPLSKRFDSSNDDIRYSKRQKAPTFYSYMGVVVDGVKQEKLGAASVINMLKGKGVKDEEIKWSGIETWLEGKKSVTKAELQEFIAGSQLQIGEQMSEFNQKAYDELEALWMANGGTPLSDTFGEEYDYPLTADNLADSLDWFRENGYDTPTADVAYRMIVLASKVETKTRWERYKLDGGTNYREIVFTMPNSTYSNNAMQAHWGQDAEGVLAHARIQDFTDADGNKMLFVEEIQSDWHNEGGKTGYIDESKRLTVDNTEMLHEGEWYNLYHNGKDLHQGISEAFIAQRFRNGITDEDIHKGLVSEYNRVAVEAGHVPDAPFRDTYQEFVLKRLIRMAAEEGYDSIGWTTAQIQSDRWSEDYAEGYRIEYDQDIPKFLRKYGKKWGAEVGKSGLSGLEVKEYLYDSERDVRFNSTNEWKKAVKDLLRTQGLTAREANTTNFVRDGEYIVAYYNGDETDRAKVITIDNKVWSMPITDYMKDSVLYEGQVMYQQRGTGMSNRSLLANALSDATQNDSEARRLEEYKAKIDLINSEEQKLQETRARIAELSFASGPKDTTAIKNLQDTATRIANRINTYDKQLLNLEATAPLKALLEREKAMARKREKEKAADALAKYREKSADTLREVMNRNTESRKKSIDSRKRTVVRNKIKRVVTDLNGLLNRGTKERNVKTDMQETVGSALKLANVLFNDEITNEDIVLMGSTMATEEEQKLLDQYVNLIKKRDSAPVDEAMRYINKMSDLNRKLADLFKRERARLNQAKVSEAVDELAKAYANLKVSDKDYVNAYYSEEAHKRLLNLSESLGGTVMKDMSLAQLEEVYDAYKMIRHIVRESNSLFRMGKTQDLAKTVTSVQGQILSLYKEREKDPRAFAKKMGDLLKDFAWNEMKPLTAFETLGADAYTELFWDAIKAEGEWAKWMEEANAFLDEQRSKFNYKSWDMDTAYEFTLPDGKVFRLTLQEMLSIYAYSKREQAQEHMTIGGFQFDKHNVYKDNDKKKRVRLGDLYVTDWSTIGNIIGSLTDEQKHYADAVQKYLTDMGQRGNEVSEILYGIGIFNETAYFPLMSAKDYRSSVEEALNNTQTQVSLKNTGMTKQTVPHASNPIILQRFDDVAIGHIDKMAKYCTQVLAIENLRRVFDSVSADDNGGYASTKAVIEKVFGESAKKYFDQYITDLNGGTFTDGAENPWMTMFSKFKGTAVGASLSVVVQQPMAVVRAMDVINAKHFIGGVSKAETDKLYDEIKRYAPVAILKEMGGFDVGSSRTARDYLGVRTDKGFNRAVDEVNDLAMWGASKADQLGWGIIWKAVKREVASNNEFKPGTAEFLEACGERFTEVIVRTQVYDSVNSRSGYMRSKRDSVKYATSFMGEPTTVINEAYLSMLKLSRADGKQAKKQAMGKLGRTMGVLVTSTLLTTLAKSLVYAMRDKEDDEALLERWAKQFADNSKSDINPLNMFPFARDIVSIFEGWDVERPDMTLIAKAITSAKRFLDRDNEKQFTNIDEVIAFIGDTANMLGLPVKNVIRDARGIVNAFGDIFDDVKPTDMGGAFISGLTGEEKAKADSLYDAIVSGDTGKVDAIKKGYKDDKAVESAIRKALRENDPRIKEAAKARYEGDVAEYMRIVREIKAEGHFSQDTIVSAINTEISELKPKEESKPSSPAFVTSTDYYNAIVSGQGSTAESIKNDLIAEKVADGDTQDDAEDSVVSGLVSQVSNAYKDGELSRSSAESILSKHCDKDADEIYWTLDKWDYAKQNGSTDGYSKYGEFHTAVETGKNLKATIKRYTDHGVEAKTLASQITSYFKPLYKEMSNAERANIKGYLLNAYALLGYNRFDKSKDIDAWLKD